MGTVMGRMGCIPILPVKRYGDGDGDGVARYEWAFTDSSSDAILPSGMYFDRNRSRNPAVWISPKQ